MVFRRVAHCPRSRLSLSPSRPTGHRQDERVSQRVLLMDTYTHAHNLSQASSDVALLAPTSPRSSPPHDHTSSSLSAHNHHSAASQGCQPTVPDGSLLRCTPQCAGMPPLRAGFHTSTTSAWWAEPRRFSTCERGILTPLSFVTSRCGAKRALKRLYLKSVEKGPVSL